MPDDYTLPSPGLLRTDIINLGPVIEPAFSDARDWNEYLTPTDTTPVVSEPGTVRLTEDDAQQAVDLALNSDSVVRGLDGKRYEIMGVRLKSLNRQTEHPLVVIYNYTDNVVVEALVDPAAQTVSEVTSEHYQPPLAPSEESLALEIVRRDGRLPKDGVDVDTGAGLIVEDVNIRSPRHGHRLVDLRFGPPDRRIPTAFAIVDLSSQDIVKVGLIPGELS